MVPGYFSVGAGERLDVTVIVLPGTTAGIPITIDITGSGAEVNLNGIYICSGNDEVSFDIRMNHLVEDCKSRQLFNGLAAGASRCAFFGKIIVKNNSKKQILNCQIINFLVQPAIKLNAAR